ncbi:hypothetical protein V7S43_006065 [Phytophthora oleae]|uniref:Uncharacterized protein n=1 Tax=Phytophthora oleae TaxID=2107226 RepID=A0ABD3FSV4_9STRA
MKTHVGALEGQLPYNRNVKNVEQERQELQRGRGEKLAMLTPVYLANEEECSA